MAIQIGDNMGYRGKKPNFERDSFDTLAEMKAYPETDIDDGHLSYCKEDDNIYKFNSTNEVDETTGKWRLFDKSITSDMVEKIIVTNQAPSIQDNILYFEYTESA